MKVVGIKGRKSMKRLVNELLQVTSLWVGARTINVPGNCSEVPTVNSISIPKRFSRPCRRLIISYGHHGWWGVERCSSEWRVRAPPGSTMTAASGSGSGTIVKWWPRARVSLIVRLHYCSLIFYSKAGESDLGRGSHSATTLSCGRTPPDSVHGIMEAFTIPRTCS